MALTTPEGAHPMRRTLALLLVPLALVACQDVQAPLTPPDEASAARMPHAQQELAAWFARAAPQVLALPQTVFADHDERANRLVFGIENAAARREVETALTRLGVPGSAYVIEVTEPIHFMSDNLRSEHRPTRGGIQIHWSQYVCTLGFNVDHSDGRSFITNSHCTDRQGEDSNTQYNQPLRSSSPEPIAFEAHDPAYFRGGPCPRGRVCRYSDAARAVYQSGTASDRGKIAKTTGVNTGSLDVAGSFTVSSQENTSTSFSGTIQKVGRTTGWTSGSVSNTCATVNVAGSNITLLCQTLVSSTHQIVAGGDSGSPVFRLGSNDNVDLVGILWGGSSSGDRFVFSPLKNIQEELGGLTATASGSGGGDNGGGDDGGGGNCPPGNPNHRNCR
jgi:hypothetical protein